MVDHSSPHRRKRLRIHGNLSPAMIVLLGIAALATAQEFSLDWFTVDNGGAMRSTSGNFELNGSIAQPDAGPPLTGEGFELTGGFWFALAPDDCNSDGGVNLYDYADFEFCMAGPHAEPPDRWCLCFDQDGDRDVDVADYAEFQQLMHNP